MAEGTIDQLTISIKSSASTAAKAIDKLSLSLANLYKNINLDVLNKFNTTLGNISDSAKGATKGLKKLSNADFSGASKGLSRISGTLSSASNFLLKGVNIAAMTSVLKNAVSTASSYYETVNYFNVAMGQFSEEAYAYAQKVSDLLGVDEDQWMNNQATFMSLAATFGNTADNAYLMSKNLTQLVYDLSSLKNVNADVAMQKLRSAFAGEIEPLRDWGVDLSKANLQLVAMEHNITKTFDNMTQAEKSQLRYVTIMNQLEYAMGDLSKTLDAPANQMRVLEASITKAARALGNIFIPLLNMVLPMLISFARIVRIVLEQIAALFNIKFPSVENWNRYSDAVDTYSGSLDKARGRAKKLKKQLAGFDEINNLTTNDSGSGSSPLTGTFGGLGLPTYESLGKNFIDPALEQRIANITVKIKELLPMLVAIGTTIMTWRGYFAALNLIPKLMKLWEWIKNLWVLISANPIMAIIALIAGVIAYVITLYNTSEEFRAKVDAILANIKAKFIEVWGVLKQKIEAISAVLKVAIEAAGNALIWLWNNILVPVGKFLGGVFKAAIIEVVAGITLAKIAFIAVGSVIKTTFTAVVSFFKTTWTTIKGIFEGIITFITGVFTGDWDKAWQGVSDIFASIFNGLKELFKIPINWIIDGINTFIKGLNKIKIPDWVPVVGGKGFHINTIQRLATGGVVSSPTTALIGESGAEAVVPLERNTEWINKVAAQISDSRSDNNETVAVLNSIYQFMQTINFSPTISVDDIGKANSVYTDKRLRIQGV